MDIYYMKRALLLAQQAAEVGEIPVGAIVVHQPAGAEAKIIGEGYNRRERDHDPTSHAEIVAMRQAGMALGHWRLLNCALYVTLEPCPMCAGAMVNARLPRLVYGASDPKAGAVETLYKICTDPRLNHRLEVVGGVLEDDAGAVLKSFFSARRSGKPL